MQARLSRLQAYLATDPRNAALLGDVSDLQLQLGLWNEARGTLATLLNIEPADTTARYRAAVAARAMGDAEAAHPLLAALVAEGNNHPAVLQELARCEAQLGRWEAVLATLSPVNAAELAPDDADAIWLLRVRAHHHLDNVNAGLAEADDWQKARGPGLPTLGLAALATLHLDAEQIDAAAALIASASDAQLKSNAELSTAAGFVELAKGHAHEARSLLAQSARMQPALGRAHLGLGLTAAYEGDLDSAVAALRTAAATAPTHLGSWHALAWMQMLTADLKGAQASMQEALARDATFGETHGGLALLAALRGDREAAEQHLRTASRLDPNGVNATVARIALQEGAGALDAQVLAPALQRFMGLAAAQSAPMRDLMNRLMPRRR